MTARWRAEVEHVGESGMDFQDKVLICADCGGEFVFTAGEQMFFADKGFKHEPKRCKLCKTKRNQNQGSRSYQRVESVISCSQCGRETTVPFKPTQGRPVYCRECYQHRRTAGAAAAV